MARRKRIYILMIKVNKLFPIYSLRCFLKEIENMFSVFLSSYRNTRDLGELEKGVETLACGSCSPKSCFCNSIETWYMFSFSCVFLKSHKYNHCSINIKINVIAFRYRSWLLCVCGGLSRKLLGSSHIREYLVETVFINMCC